MQCFVNLFEGMGCREVGEHLGNHPGIDFQAYS